MYEKYLYNLSNKSRIKIAAGGVIFLSLAGQTIAEIQDPNIGFSYNPLSWVATPAVTLIRDFEGPKFIPDHNDESITIPHS